MAQVFVEAVSCGEFRLLVQQGFDGLEVQDRTQQVLRQHRQKCDVCAQFHARLLRLVAIATEITPPADYQMEDLQDLAEQILNDVSDDTRKALIDMICNLFPLGKLLLVLQRHAEGKKHDDDEAVTVRVRNLPTSADYPQPVTTGGNGGDHHATTGGDHGYANNSGSQKRVPFPAATVPTGQRARGLAARPEPEPAMAQAAHAKVDTSQASRKKQKIFEFDDPGIDELFRKNLGLHEIQQYLSTVAEETQEVFPSEISDLSLDVVADLLPEDLRGPFELPELGRLVVRKNEEEMPGNIRQLNKFLFEPGDVELFENLINRSRNRQNVREVTEEAAEAVEKLLQFLGQQPGVIGSIMLAADGSIVAHKIPKPYEVDNVAIWSFASFINGANAAKILNHDQCKQIVSKTERGYEIVVNFHRGILITLVDGGDTETLVPLMRLITALTE